MAQHPFQDVMAQRSVCSKGRTPHPMISIGMAEAGTAVTLDGGVLEGRVLMLRRYSIIFILI
jgi:hypothetical protein